jgi:hypothetical protein
MRSGDNGSGGADSGAGSFGKEPRGALDRWIAKQDARMTRPKAIRALVAAGLKAKK